jgi:hypothetical protein
MASWILLAAISVYLISDIIRDRTLLLRVRRLEHDVDILHELLELTDAYELLAEDLFEE